MMLVIKTDEPQAKLWLVEQGDIVDRVFWDGHRRLAETLHATIHGLLRANNLDWQDLSKVAVYEGPGSFTGLRIGMSVANSLAFSLQIPVVSFGGEDWEKHLKAIEASAPTTTYAQPAYGAPATITTPKK